MKILIATDTYYPHVNGASYFGQRLAHYLTLRGHHVVVVAPSTTLHHRRDMINGIVVEGIRSFPVFFYQKFRFSPQFFIQRHIRNVVQAFHPDIIHLQGHFFISRTVLRVGRKESIPVIATNHFMPENLLHYIPLPSFLRNVLGNFAWKDCANVFNRAYAVTTPTHAAAALVPKKQLQKSVRVISNGIDLKRFNPKNNSGEIWQKYHLPEKPLLLYVGRLDREKNLDMVLRALARAAQTVNIHFVIAGTGADRSRLELLVKKLSLENVVTFTGFVADEDLPSLYVSADCFAMAGTAELQSIATMEAMASGLPIIAVRAVALPELVHDEENGFLFNPDDIRQLSHTIEAIFSDRDRKERMGKKSLEFIAPHNIETIISSFENLYQEAISKTI